MNAKFHFGVNLSSYSDPRPRLHKMIFVQLVLPVILTYDGVMVAQKMGFS